MRQVLQDATAGTIRVESVPAPALQPRHLLIRSSTSLISAGTERMLAEFAKASLVGKALQNPEHLKRVLDKVRTDGLLSTLDAVRGKLEQPLTPGYCNAGVVIGLGEGVVGFGMGDRVASNGSHAEVVSVPQNLCARIPDTVEDETAAFTVLCSIALQGVRLAQPTLGECFAVTGLGLVGLSAVQMLRAHGCRVLGIDVEPNRLALARDLGAETVDVGKGEDPVAAAQSFSRGRGMDGAILALASQSSEPVSQAARMCRKRGRIILVGVTGLELSRRDFYEKELSFQVSCSYGPGRYDAAYESGRDYPAGFVRWTAQRNFEAVLDMMAEGRLRLAPLVSHRFPIDRAAEAYELLTSKQPSVGILLQYTRAECEAPATSVTLPSARVAAASPEIRTAFIGAGNYGGRVLIPAFKAAGAHLTTVVTRSGASCVHYGKKFGFANAATDVDPVLKGDDDAVAIATRHDSHASLAARCLESGKHVFVEKPLALTYDELDRVERALRASERLLMVGFNRRFAPQVARMKGLLAPLAEPKAFIMTVNAGALPSEHWTQDRELGGGRIAGEACHFIDLLRHLAGRPIEVWNVISCAGAPGGGDDRAVISLRFSDGSIGSIHYLANGHPSVSKERLEVFAGGRILQLDNFRRLSAHGWPSSSAMHLWRQDKGHSACVAAFLRACRSGGPPPIPYSELLEVTRVTIAIAEAARNPTGR